MRKIPNKKWDIIAPDGSKQQESTIVALTVVMNSKKPESMPKGLDNFRLFSRIAKAFDKADKDGIIVLEEADYKFIKDSVFNDVPSFWGMNPNIVAAIDSFLEAKEE